MTARGFTLIEMLVVLVIMGLLVGLISAVAQPDDKTRLRVEADRLTQLMQVATTQARFSGKSIAWTSNGSSYRFWQMNPEGDWSALLNDELLRARTLPPGMMIENMRVENIPSPKLMRVEFNAYGDVLAFSLDMSLGTSRYILINSPVGELSVIPAQGRVDDKMGGR